MKVNDPPNYNTKLKGAICLIDLCKTDFSTVTTYTFRTLNIEEKNINEKLEKKPRIKKLNLSTTDF